MGSGGSVPYHAACMTRAWVLEVTVVYASPVQEQVNILRCWAGVGENLSSSNDVSITDEKLR
jgi:hypothetical protein